MKQVDHIVYRGPKTKVRYKVWNKVNRDLEHATRRNISTPEMRLTPWLIIEGRVREIVNEGN